MFTIRTKRRGAACARLSAGPEALVRALLLPDRAEGESSFQFLVFSFQFFSYLMSDACFQLASPSIRIKPGVERVRNAPGWLPQHISKPMKRATDFQFLGSSKKGLIVGLILLPFRFTEIALLSERIR